MNIGGFEQGCPGVQPTAPVGFGINLGPAIPPSRARRRLTSTG
jgi:hypothetical protein